MPDDELGVEGDLLEPASGAEPEAAPEAPSAPPGKARVAALSDEELDQLLSDEGSRKRLWARPSIQSEIDSRAAARAKAEVRKALQQERQRSDQERQTAATQAQAQQQEAAWAGQFEALEPEDQAAYLKRYPQSHEILARHHQRQALSSEDAQRLRGEAMQEGRTWAVQTFLMPYLEDPAFQALPEEVQRSLDFRREGAKQYESFAEWREEYYKSLRAHETKDLDARIERKAKEIAASLLKERVAQEREGEETPPVLPPGSTGGQASNYSEAASLWTEDKMSDAEFNKWRARVGLPVYKKT